MLDSEKPVSDVLQVTDSTLKPQESVSLKVIHGESTLRSFSGLLFGSFNGIQIFLYPSLLFYWLEGDSLVYSISDLIMSRLHFVPVIVFLLTFLYMVLILLKNEYYLRQNHAHGSSSKKGEFSRFVVDIHAKLLVVLIIFMVLYVFTVFMKYFYGINVPLRLILSIALRLLGMLLIMYYFILHQWISVWRRRGHGISNCRTRLLAYIRANPGQFIRFTVLMMGIVVLFSKLYTLMLQYIYMPILAIIGDMLDIHPHLSMQPFSSVFAALYNVAVVAAAVLLSNLFFIPLVWLAGRMLDRLHPMR